MGRPEIPRSFSIIVSRNIKSFSFSGLATLVLASGLFPTAVVAQSYGLTERQPIDA